MSEDKPGLNRHVSGKMCTVKEDGIKDDERATNDCAKFQGKKIYLAPWRRKTAEAHRCCKKDLGWN